MRHGVEQGARNPGSTQGYLTCQETVVVWAHVSSFYLGNAYVMTRICESYISNKTVDLLQSDRDSARCVSIAMRGCFADPPKPAKNKLQLPR